jgi:hypothetical protein
MFNSRFLQQSKLSNQSALSSALGVETSPTANSGLFKPRCKPLRVSSMLEEAETFLVKQAAQTFYLPFDRVSKTASGQRRHRNQT